MATVKTLGASALEKARKAAKLDIAGRTVEHIANLMGITEQSVRGYLALASCAKPVQIAVENGTVAASVAVHLARLPKDEQGAALQKLIADGKASGIQGIKAASKAGGRVPRIRMKGRKHLSSVLKRIEGAERDERPDAVKVLRYVLGDESALAAKWRAAGAQ